MTGKRRRRLGTSVLIAAVLTLLAGSANAFQVTVGGITYNVTIEGFVADRRFDIANNPSNADGQLTSASSWFNDRALAQAVASEVDPSQFPTGVTNVFFAYNLNGGGTQVDFWNRSSGSPSASDERRRTNRNQGDLSAFEAWAFGTASPVPEIDGPVFAQALFVLLVLYLLLLRHRRDATRRP